MSDARRPARDSLTGRPAAGAALSIALVLALIGCSNTEESFVPLPVPTGARILALTLDACECISCRVAVQNPETGAVLLNRVGLPVGSPFVVEGCYTELTVRATLECGLCPGPGPCTATATLTASGDLPAGSPVTCTTPAFAGASCQNQQLLTISDTSPTVGCAP